MSGMDEIKALISRQERKCKEISMNPEHLKNNLRTEK
jgi:hypothetical protein